MVSFYEFLHRKTNEFYMGRLYPVIVCLLICVGQITAKEHITIPINVLLACGALLVCSSIRPIITILCAFVYSLSRENAFFGSSSSDFFFTGWRVVAFWVLLTVVVVSFISFFRRNSFFKRVGLGKTPLLLPLILLCAAFLLNGVRSGEWVSGSLLYGFLQVVAYGFVFVIFYHGFSDEESSQELADYFAYVGVLISLVLIAEMAAVYITNGVFIDGVIHRENIKFGWGIGNTAGIYLNLLVPLGFYATYRSRRLAIPYFIVTTLTYAAAIFTISRNALLFGTASYFIILLIFCFVGEKKKFFRIWALIIVAAAAVAFALYHDQILTAFKSYVDRGMDDSSRFSIWQTAWERFKENPIFGNGFRGLLFESGSAVSFIPIMSHNTVFQILFSMGLVGFCSYALYRLCTLAPFFKRPSIMKCMLGALILVILGESLLDNFVFHIQPMFYYSIALAIVYRSHKHDVAAKARGRRR